MIISFVFVIAFIGAWYFSDKALYARIKEEVQNTFKFAILGGMCFGIMVTLFVLTLFKLL